jgi:hypothetical protein
MYNIKPLEAFENDLTSITKYISEELCNPSAAKKLRVELWNSINLLKTFPFIQASDVEINDI